MARILGIRDGSSYICALCGCTSDPLTGDEEPDECRFCDRDGADERWIGALPTTRLLQILASHDAFAIARLATYGEPTPPPRLLSALRFVPRRPHATGYVWRLAQAEINRRIPPRFP